jgi:hypothetical protein
MQKEVFSVVGPIKLRKIDVVIKNTIQLEELQFKMKTRLI